jgi:hypothetical protein
LGNQQTVFPDLDVFGKNRIERRQQGDFNSQFWEFFRADGRESRIVQSGTARTPHDGLRQRLDGFDGADAAAQSAASVESHEHAAFLYKNPTLRISSVGFLEGNGVSDRPARQIEQKLSIGFREG